VIKAKEFRLKVSSIKFSLLRNIAGLLSMLLMFYVLKHIPVATGVLLLNTSSLFVPLMMFILFRQKTSLPVILFTLLGFLGVVIVLFPAIQKQHADLIFLLLGILSAFFAALAYIAIKKLSQHDSPLQIIFYFYLTGTVVLLLFSHNWITPSANQLTLLAMVGLFGLLFQLGMNYALKFAAITTIVPFVFTGVIFAGCFDWLLWSTLPSIYFWIGCITISIAICSITKLNA
jgi:drug/metabolite transporter (DMT)-like permease